MASNFAAFVDSLKQQNLDQILIHPGTDDYESELGRFWNRTNQEIRPKVIAAPRTTEEASKLVRALSDARIEFAICSGGANPNVGFNNSSQLLITTTHLNEGVTFPQSDRVRVGPGMKWETLYQILLDKGQTAVGARSKAAAIGGSLLGGGLSHLSNEYGCSADNVFSYEVVLGSGEVVMADAERNADLFWALKGGGNSFGLVTQIDIKVIQQKDGVWGGSLMINPQYLKQTCDALYDWQMNDQPKDLKAAIELILLRSAPTGGMEITMPIVFIYYGAPVENPECLRRFTELPTVYSTLGIRTHLDLTKELSQSIFNDKRHLFYTGTYRSDPTLNIESHNLFYEILREAQVEDVSLAAMTLQPIGESMLKYGDGKNALGLACENAPYVWWNLAIEYIDSSKEATVLKVAQDFTSRFREKAEAIDKHEKFLFFNDAGPDQDPLPSYGEGILARLKNVQVKYDPGRVFTDLCVGGYKLG